MPDIPKRFPSQNTDRYINYLRGVGEMMIQMELEFDHHLDTNRLEKSLDLTLDAEPILGCRFVPRWWRPYWERLNSEDRPVLNIANDISEYEKFKIAPIDPYTGPQIKACLLRTTDRDCLLIKVAHEVSDAGGVRQIARTVSSIYSRLADEPDYHPEPNINGSRSTRQILRCIPWHAYPIIFYNYYRLWFIPSCVLPPKSTHLPVMKDNDRTLEFISRRVPADAFKRITEYSHQHKGTVNDMIITSFFYALISVVRPGRLPQWKLLVPVDLRRLKPDGKGDGICNLSGMELVDLGISLGDSFDHTFERVSSFMHRRKDRWIGVGEHIGLAPLSVIFPYAVLKRTLPYLTQISFDVGMAAHCFTNMGAINKEDVTFDMPPVDARLLSPVDYPPHILFCFSSYNGSLTISAGSWPCTKKQIEQFFDAMLKELQNIGS